MTLSTRDISILLTGLLAAVCCGCLAPGQARAPRVQTATIAREYSFTYPKPQEPRVAPEYPERERREDIEGQVKLWLTIDPSGRVIAVTPATEAPDQDFYEAAKRAALAQRWNPAKHDGNPVFIVIQYTYSFRLGSRAEAVPSGKAPEAE